MKRALPTALKRATAGVRLSNGFEHLESRRMLSSTPFAVTPTSPFSQNWTNIGLITANDDWAGVPAIVGYRGDLLDSTTTTPLDPTTILADTAAGTSPNPVDVNANQTNTRSFNTGGVTEFELTGNPTIALAGSGTADAPNFVINLDTTAVTSVRVQYTLRDLEGPAGGQSTGGTSDNAIMPVALQYRIGSTGNFTNVPLAYVADATQGPDIFGPDIPVDVTIAGIGGQSLVQLRIISVNAAGNDEWVGVDDINVSQAAVSTNNGKLGFGSATVNAGENAGTYNLVVSRSEGTSGAVTADYTITPGSASTPADFTAALTGTVSFANGVDTAIIPITITDDFLVEGTESFGVALSNPTGGAVLSAIPATTVSIADNDAFGTGISFNPLTYTVNENAGTVTLTIQRFGGGNAAVTVPFTVIDGTATAGSDFTTTSGNFVFAEGATTATATVTLVNDTIGAPLDGTSESFTVTLGAPTPGGTLSTNTASLTATVNITDDDNNGILDFNPLTYSVSEGVAGGTVTLTVKRTGGTSGAVSAAWTTVNGTATSPGDFTAASGTVNFADGSDTATIVITLVNDAVTEGSEQFTVVLSNVTGGAAFGSGTTATVTITNDDSNAPTGLVLNEMLIDPIGTNQPYQFFELRGTPNSVLSDVYILVIEGDTNGSNSPGQLDFTINLTGAVIGSNGILLVKSDSFTSGQENGFVKPGGNPTTPAFETVDPATGVFRTTVLNSQLELGSQSYLLVFRDSTGATLPTLGTDLDLDNTQTSDANLGLEGLPASVTILDGIGAPDGSTADIVYGAQLAPIASSTDTSPAGMDSIVRFVGNTTVFDPSAFYYGTIAGSNAQATVTFSTNAADNSTNFPSGGLMTPGSINVPVPSDTTAPTVVSAVFDRNAGQKVVVTFSEDVRNTSNTIIASDFTLARSGGSNVELVVSNVSSDGKVVTLSFTNTGGLMPTGASTSTILLDGNYTFTAKSGQIADLVGNTLASDAVSTFAFKNADFVGTGNTVDFDDLLAVAQNYGKPSDATFSQGDANYDGKVDFDDLLALAQRYGTGLPAVVAAPAAKAASKRTTATKSVLGTSTAIV